MASVYPETAGMLQSGVGILGFVGYTSRGIALGIAIVGKIVLF